MADINKKDKIAAAKKKLKQFQQRSGRTPSRSPAPNSRASLEKEDGGDSQPIEQKSRRSISPVPEQPASDAGTRGRPVSRKSDLAESPPGKQAVDGHSSPNQNQEELRLPTHSIAVTPSNSQSVEASHWLSSDRTTASTESLHQLSRQLNGLLAESADYSNAVDASGSSIEELETRNRELAALLEKHSQANEQLNTQNFQLRDHAKSLQDQLDSERNSFNEKYKKDVGSLKEQLQVHIQTIGILVAEKTELQSQVGQSQRIADQRLEEIEELSGRLKASRQRVADLERSLSTSSQSGQQLEKSNKENTKEIDRLKLDLYKATKANEESKQQISELTEKLHSKVSEAAALEQNTEDLKKRLEMAEIYAQQLSSESENSAGNVKMLTDLQTQRDNLLLKIKQFEETVHSLRQERDQVNDHYQQQAAELTKQIQKLTQQIFSLSGEREELLSRQHELEGAVFELQRKLEDSAVQHSAQKEDAVDHAAQDHVIAELEKLRCDLHEVQQRHEAQIRDNAQLSRFLEEREAKVLELEQQVDHMGSQVEDRTSLLESVHSDRTALSRALSQNKVLKEQLAELQNGFVKLSNDNMELVTKLQGAEHSSNDLAAKLAQQEDELTALREELSRREAEVQSLKDASQASLKQQYQQDQIQDRLRHYEAQAQLVNTLQNELTAAQDMMEALTTQNSELRTMLIKATEVKDKAVENGSENGDDSRADDLIDSLHATIKQLELERGQLYESLKEQRHLSDNLSVKVADLQEEVIRKASDYVDSDKISRSEYEQLRTAMEMIQEKYTTVMRDKAELTDKADQLEHLVVQLQGESDTIGEYISLYHHQRALLQQREIHKNEYIAQLARDREQLQDKMGELQALVMQLLGERNMLHSYSREATSPSESVTNGDHPHHHHPHVHSRPHKHQAVDPTLQPHLAGKDQTLTNGPIENSYADWPDYTSSESDAESEVEPIIGGVEIPPSPSSDTSDLPLGLNQDSAPGGDSASLKPGHTHHHHHHHHPHHGGRHRTHSTGSQSVGGGGGSVASGVQEEDETAHRILNLLSEIGHSNLVNKLPFAERNFLPCKFCKGAVQIV